MQIRFLLPFWLACLPIALCAQTKSVAVLSEDAGIPIAPVPADPHELVTGGAVAATTPAERAALLGLYERAKENSDLHIAGTPPFFLKATFNIAGHGSLNGAGALTETWMSGRSWRWTANIGDYSQIRIGSNGIIVDQQQLPVIPMRIQSLRSAIFWPLQEPFSPLLRSANVQWNGHPVTCILNSRTMNPDIPGRQWVEEEYCIDPASGLLEIHSPAPGSFIVYSYRKNQQFHGRVMPDHINAYIAGETVIEAQVDITDAGPVDHAELKPTPRMLRSGPAVVLQTAPRFPLPTPGPAGSTVIQPVIVHVIIGANGRITDEEISAAADPALSSPALDLVRNMTFEPGRVQQETYVNVRFMPPSE